MTAAEEKRPAYVVEDVRRLRVLDADVPAPNIASNALIAAGPPYWARVAGSARRVNGVSSYL